MRKEEWIKKKLFTLNWESKRGIGTLSGTLTSDMFSSGGKMIREYSVFPGNFQIQRSAFEV